MKYILSFKDGHDPAAAILKDGVIIAAAEEERFNRIKHAPSFFPEQSIRYCLSRAGIRAEDVDYLVYARLKPFKTFFVVSAYYLLHPPTNWIEIRYAISHMKVQVRGVTQQLLGKANYQKVWKIFPNITRKLHSFDHHLCHVASAYYFSGFEESLILSMDGKGEATSVMVAEGKGLEIKIRERRGIFQSLGMFYSSLTEYLGFTPNDGEYKVMGLAPYGKPMEDFSGILSPAYKAGYKINSKFVLHPFSVDSFVSRFGPARSRESEFQEKHFNIGASAQKALEDSVLSLVKNFSTEKRGNLCLAGGVALNVKMNKVIWESGLFDNLFIQPAAGDDGLVLGACALMYVRVTNKRVEPLNDLYFGPDFDNNQIESVLVNSKLKYQKSENICADTALLLGEGMVVGWFQGRMEFGPRALGNRSVLANPCIKEMQDVVNSKIKFRESFRPFCPSVLVGEAENYFKNYKKSPYMITSFEVKEGIKDKIPAVVHVDNTSRPQSVEKEINPKYYSLIEEFKKITGVGVLLNTSMNVRGEPIVCTPEDAINFFLKTNVDVLVMGDYLVSRNGQNSEVFQTLSYESLDTKY